MEAPTVARPASRPSPRVRDAQPTLSGPGSARATGRALAAAGAIAGLLLASSAGGCYPATGPAPGDTVEQEQFWTGQPEDVRIAALAREIGRMCPRASPAEVAAISGTTIRYGELLRDEYGLSRPPEYNNVAIALGLKQKRGRCYELADDLYIRLRAMRLRTLQLHRAISKEGHPTDEHNVVIVTDLGRPIEAGVVLDLWRYAGKARFIAVADDHQHEWKERPITVSPPAELVVDDVTPR